MDSKAFRVKFMEKFNALPDRNMAALARRAGVSYNVVRDLVRRIDATTSAEHARALAREMGFSADTLEDFNESLADRARREELDALIRRLPVKHHADAIRMLQGMVLLSEQEAKDGQLPPANLLPE